MGLPTTPHQPFLRAACGLPDRPSHHWPIASGQFGVASFPRPCCGCSSCARTFGFASSTARGTVAASRCLADGMRHVGMWCRPHHARAASAGFSTSCASTFGHARRLELERPYCGCLGCTQPRASSAAATLARYDSYWHGLVMDDQTSPSFSGRQHK